jgi:RNA polymerase sigma factor (sigma-70 family)
MLHPVSCPIALESVPSRATSPNVCGLALVCIGVTTFAQTNRYPAVTERALAKTRSSSKIDEGSRRLGLAEAARGRARWEEVVTRLVTERGAALTKYAYLISGSQDDAADLVQDALVKTFGRLSNGYSIASAEAYVRRAILNTYLDAGRRTSRWRKIAHLQAAPEHIDPADSHTESRIDMQAQLHKLTPRERACVVLRYYEDLKVDDIADWLHISPGAVKRYLSDALAKMAVSLADERPDSTKGATHAH